MNTTELKEYIDTPMYIRNKTDFFSDSISSIFKSNVDVKMHTTELKEYIDTPIYTAYNMY